MLTESQNTSLRGFNNEKGTTNLNGIYRWVDKTYTARLLNYGKRLMLPLNPPEPAAFFRALLAQGQAELSADLEEPVPPSGVNIKDGRPIEEGARRTGFQSYQDISVDNYARFAALYDVQVLPPPPPTIAGAKAIAVPTAMEAAKVESHSAEGKELSYAAVDSGLSVNPNYRDQQGRRVRAVRRPGPLLRRDVEARRRQRRQQGARDGRGQIAPLQRRWPGRQQTPEDSHELQRDAGRHRVGHRRQHDAVAVADQDRRRLRRHAVAERDLPAVLRPDAYDAWKSSVYADIVKGYTAKKPGLRPGAASQPCKAKQAAAVAAQTYHAARGPSTGGSRLTELKRGCIELLTEEPQPAHTSIARRDRRHAPRIVYRRGGGGSLLRGLARRRCQRRGGGDLRAAFEWSEMAPPTSSYPYYWAGSTGGGRSWRRRARRDPQCSKQFLRAGNASVLVPVRPASSARCMLFLKTGLIWGGGYLLAVHLAGHARRLRRRRARPPDRPAGADRRVTGRSDCRRAWGNAARGRHAADLRGRGGAPRSRRTPGRR